MNGYSRRSAAGKKIGTVVRLEMQVAQHAVLKHMHSEVEIHHHCRPGKERGQCVMPLYVSLHLHRETSGPKSTHAVTCDMPLLFHPF